jgi:hypothetical protein
VLTHFDRLLFTEREVPIQPPDPGSWKLGDPLTPDMIRVRTPRPQPQETTPR